MTNNQRSILIDDTEVGDDNKTYFVADIGANHDGNLERAKELIWLAAESGANAAKFQHFSAQSIVSDYGFKNLGKQSSHQKNWKKSVYDVYKEASLNTDWTHELKNTCDKAGITFFTSPYSKELVEHIDKYVEAYKIGSGDITWLEIIDYISEKGKPILLATGASTISDVIQAVNIILAKNSNLILMQCNTNYTGNIENFKYINLNVLKLFKLLYPDLILGLSDHTPGHSTVLGAVTLGAKVIEKHFTDDSNREGPDHKFAMDKTSWKEMVDRTRELELALGGCIKKVEENEKETVVLQRRALRAVVDLSKDDIIREENMFPLRPCPKDALEPHELKKLLGKKINTDIKQGDIVRWQDVKM